MSRTRAGLVGGAFVLTAIALQHYFMGPAVAVLSVGLLISLVLWLANYRSYDRIRIGRIRWIYGAAVVVQAIHFAEEYFNGFQREFPSLWGYGWSDALFAGFNLVALGVFVLAAIGLFLGVRLALLLVWFMAIVGGLGNGLFHTAMTLSRGAYFPGFYTGLLHLVVGLLLLRELRGAK